MKKFFLLPILFLIIGLVVMPMTASAASVGNPDTLGKTGAVALGLEYDSSRQDLSLKSGVIADEFGSESFDATGMSIRSKTKYVVGTVGILPNLDAFVGLGVNDAKLGLDVGFGEGSDHVEIRDKSNLDYKLGVRGTFAEVAGITFGAMAQYRAYALDGKFSVNGENLDVMISPSTYTTETKVHEWQAAATASTHVWRLTPYAGVTYLKTSAVNRTMIAMNTEGYSDSSMEIKAGQKHHFGGVIGAGMNVVGNLDANVEGRFGNEDALTASASYRF